MKTDAQLETETTEKSCCESTVTPSDAKVVDAHDWYTLALETDRLLAVKGGHQSVAEAFAAGRHITLADHADLKRMAALHMRELIVRTEPFSHIRGYFPSLRPSHARTH